MLLLFTAAYLFIVSHIYLWVADQCATQFDIPTHSLVFGLVAVFVSQEDIYSIYSILHIKYWDNTDINHFIEAFDNHIPPQTVFHFVKF